MRSARLKQGRPKRSYIAANACMSPRWARASVIASTSCAKPVLGSCTAVMADKTSARASASHSRRRGIAVYELDFAYAALGYDELRVAAAFCADAQFDVVVVRRNDETLDFLAA